MTGARTPGPRALPHPRERLALGRGGLRVSPLCVGAVEDSRAIGAAFELGVNFFFLTADMHWPLYEASRRGLADLFASRAGARDEVVVAVASYVTQPEFCHTPFREVLEALPSLGRIEVTVAAGSYRSDFDARAAEYTRHTPFGVRAFAASFHDRSMASDALCNARVDLAFVRYNPRHRGAERDLFPALAGAPTAPQRPLVFNFTSTQGHLRGADYATLGVPETHWRPAVTDYYRFALGRPELDGLLCSPRTPAQVEALSRALEAGPLTDEEREYIADLGDLATGRASLA